MPADSIKHPLIADFDFNWATQSGFDSFGFLIKYYWLQKLNTIQELKLIAPEKSIDYIIIDACNPVKYQNQSTKLLLTSNCIQSGLLDTKYYEQFPLSWYGLYSGNVAFDEISPVKDFNCFINRMDIIRQSWLYQLIRRGMFNQGYISFNMDVSRHMQFGHWESNSTSFEIFEKQFQQHLSIFEPEHNFIKNQIPYRNFDHSLNLNQIIMQTKFSIVLETFFDCNQIITFSEKIFRCLKLPRPWILFAMKGAVGYIRHMGFDVLDDIVDHSYDNIEFDIDRQIKLLDIAKNLCSITFTFALQKRLTQAALHNQQLLNEMKKTYIIDVDNTISRAKRKFMEL